MPSLPIIEVDHEFTIPHHTDPRDRHIETPDGDHHYCTYYFMARRKRILEDDDSSDASADSDDADFNMNEDADERAERDLLENPYGRKRRRRGNGKDDATYGVFGGNSEEEGFGGHRKKEEKRSDWTKYVLW